MKQETFIHRFSDIDLATRTGYAYALGSEAEYPGLAVAFELSASVTLKTNHVVPPERAKRDSRVTLSRLDAGMEIL